MTDTDADPAESAARGYFESISNADQEAFVAQFAPDVRFADPVGGPVLEGHDGVAKFHRGLRRAWARLVMKPDFVLARGWRVAAHWRASGQSAGGKQIDFEGINTFVVDERGHIVQLEGFWDFEGVIARM